MIYHKYDGKLPLDEFDPASEVEIKDAVLSEISLIESTQAFQAVSMTIFVVNSMIVTSVLVAAMYLFGKAKRAAVEKDLEFAYKMPQLCELRQLPLLLTCFL